MNLERDGDGFLINMNDWTHDVMFAMAEADGFEMTDQILSLINQAREMYEEDNVVPPIRKFAKKVGVSNKELYTIFKSGPMKLIAKYGGLPKPTGCV